MYSRDPNEISLTPTFLAPGLKDQSVQYTSTSNARQSFLTSTVQRPPVTKNPFSEHIYVTSYAPSPARPAHILVLDRGGQATMEDTFSFSEALPMTTMLTDTGLTNPVDTQSTFGRVPRELSEDEAREATAAVLDEFLAEVPGFNQRVYLVGFVVCGLGFN